MLFLDSTFLPPSLWLGRVPGPLSGTFSLYTLSVFSSAAQSVSLYNKNSQINSSQPDCTLWGCRLQSTALRASQQEFSIPLPPGGQQHSAPLWVRFPPRTSHLLTWTPRPLQFLSPLLPQIPSLTCPPSKISSSCSPTQVFLHAKDLQKALF